MTSHNSKKSLKVSPKNLKYYKYQRNKQGRALLSKPLVLQKISSKKCKQILKSKMTCDKQKRHLQSHVKKLSTIILKNKVSCGKQKQILQGKLDEIERKKQMNKERYEKARVNRAKNEAGFFKDFKNFMDLKQDNKIPKSLLFEEYLKNYKGKKFSSKKRKSSRVNRVVNNVQHLIKKKK